MFIINLIFQNNLFQPIISEQVVNRLIIPSNKDYNSKLYCPHDFSHDSEFRDDLPTLMGENGETEIFSSNFVLADFWFRSAFRSIPLI